MITAATRPIQFSAFNALDPPDQEEEHSKNRGRDRDVQQIHPGTPVRPVTPPRRAAAAAPGATPVGPAWAGRRKARSGAQRANQLQAPASRVGSGPNGTYAAEPAFLTRPLRARSKCQPPVWSRLVPGKPAPAWG